MITTDMIAFALVDSTKLEIVLFDERGRKLQNWLFKMPDKKILMDLASGLKRKTLETRDRFVNVPPMLFEEILVAWERLLVAQGIQH